VLRDGRVVQVLDTGRKGRASAYTEGLEAQLRSLLGEGDSTRLRIEPKTQVGFGWLWPVLSIVLGLVVWQVAAALLNQPFLLPTPMAVWKTLLQNLPVLIASLAITAQTAVLGFLFGTAAGLLIGYPLGRSPWLERFLSPFLVASQSTPTVVLAPLLVTYLGYGKLSAVVVAALSAIYPVVVAVMVGVRDTDRGYKELFRSLHASPLQTLTHLELPGALPVLLGGMRLALSLSLIGAVVWEFIDPNQRGIGFQVTQAGIYFNKPLQFAGISLLVLLGIVFYLSVTLLERRVLRGRRQD